MELDKATKAQVWAALATVLLGTGIVMSITLHGTGLFLGLAMMGVGVVIFGVLLIDSRTRAVLRHPIRSRVGGIFPDVEFQVGGMGFHARERQFGELRVPYRVRSFRNVRITNHESERRVSLTFHCRKPTVGPDEEIDKLPLLPTTPMPLDIEPKSSRQTDLEFEDTMN